MNTSMATAKQITAVIFDLDQTLVDRTSTFTLFLGTQYARCRSMLADIAEEIFLDTILQQDNNGYSDKAQIYQSIETLFALKPGVGSALHEDFKIQYGVSPILFPQTHEVLAYLKDI